jgi:hypothetical protein
VLCLVTPGPVRCELRFLPEWSQLLAQVSEPPSLVPLSFSTETALAVSGLDPIILWKNPLLTPRDESFEEKQMP